MIFSTIRNKLLYNKLLSLRKKRKYYTFKCSDFETIYIKKLENNKIFYNGFIYDENFFYYEKLNELFIHINEHRDFYLEKSFEQIRTEAEQQGQILRVIDFYLDKNGECRNLTKTQYNLVVAAYTYNIPYMSFTDYFYPAIDLYTPDTKNNFKLIKDLLPDWLYINGWKSIKPVFGVFETASYKLYNDGMAVYRESNYDHPLVKYGFTRALNPQFPKDNPNETIWGFEGLYMHQWCIKPQFHENMINENPKRFILAGDFFGEREGDFSDDDIIEENENDWHLPICNQHQAQIDFNKSKGLFLETKNDLFFEKSELTKVDDIFIGKHNPLNEGARMRYDWFDYDEDKKFQEFDINCKTNTYHMRYKYYNEIAWKDYPEEKKYKTETVYDFTEEEIQSNYDNMVDKRIKAVDRIEYVLKKKKAYNHLIDFLKQVEFIDLYLFKYPAYAVEPDEYGFFGTKYDTDLWIYEKNKRRLYELLNDPQYLLIMPVLDAFFEMWRNNGWYVGDETFNDYLLGISGEFYYLDDCKRLLRTEHIYVLTRERQQFEVLNDCWAIQDYVEHVIHEDLGDDIEDLLIGITMALVLFAWLLLVTIYFGAFWGPILNHKYNSGAIMYNYAYSWAYYDYFRPKLLWDLEVKGPRNLLKHGKRFKTLYWRLTHYSRYHSYKYKLYFRPWLWSKPSKMPYMFEESHFFPKWRKRRKIMGLLPLSIGWKIQTSLDNDNKVFGLYTIHEKLVYFGRRTGISIYDLNGKLRIRWWTRLNLYIRKTINDFILQLYADILKYLNEPMQELETLRNSRGKLRPPTDLESAEAEKERIRRFRVVCFLAFMVFLILLLITWICCYFIYHAIANFFADIFDSDL